MGKNSTKGIFFSTSFFESTLQHKNLRQNEKKKKKVKKYHPYFPWVHRLMTCSVSLKNKTKQHILQPRCRSASLEENGWLFLQETLSVLQGLLVVAKYCTQFQQNWFQHHGNAFRNDCFWGTVLRILFVRFFVCLFSANASASPEQPQYGKWSSGNLIREEINTHSEPQLLLASPAGNSLWKPALWEGTNPTSLNPTYLQRGDYKT